MPAQKRPPTSDSTLLGSEDSSPPSPPFPPSPPPSPPSPPSHHLQQQGSGGDEQPPTNQPQEQLQDPEESDGDSGSRTSGSETDKDEYILVNLAEVRKEFQCPICLGIIRKTRTVMECLHRFCRECIDKSMRLGNNECPACRTHCASRRSLRDDPNYDSLIAALYPDIDKYEEEELAFDETEKTRNKKIQASIAETFRRQTEALGRRRSTPKAMAVAFARKSQGHFRNTNGQSSYLRGRGRSGGRSTALAGSDDDEEDANGNDGGNDTSSADECSQDLRQKRYKRWAASQSSPARTGNSEVGCEENDDIEMGRENLGTSSLRAGNREVLMWGKGGARSQTRHGNSSISNGRILKGRMTKLVEFLRNLDENDDEFDVHLTLLPLDEQSMPNLLQPYLCCRPTLSISHLCQFVALQISAQAEEVEIYIRKPQSGSSAIKPSTSVVKTESDPSEELQILRADESLGGFHDYFTSSRGNLVLVYRLKMQSYEAV